FFFQAEDGIRDFHVTGVQTCALPISLGMKVPGLKGSLPVEKSKVNWPSSTRYVAEPATGWVPEILQVPLPRLVIEVSVRSVVELDRKSGVEGTSVGKTRDRVHREKWE